MLRTTLPIDGQKLDYILAKKNLKKCAVSEEMGYSASYLTWVCKSGTIAKAATILLKKLYNVEYDVYKAEEEEINEEVSEGVDTSFTFDYDKLNEILYDAVFRAVRDALKS